MWPSDRSHKAKALSPSLNSSYHTGSHAWPDIRPNPAPARRVVRSKVHCNAGSHLPVAGLDPWTGLKTWGSLGGPESIRGMWVCAQDPDELGGCGKGRAWPDPSGDAFLSLLFLFLLSSFLSFSCFLSFFSFLSSSFFLSSLFLSFSSFSLHITLSSACTHTLYDEIKLT